MSQLGRVASVTRKIIKYGGLGLVSYIILSWIFKFGVILWHQLNPPPPPPPTVAFGKLKAIEFPVSATDQQFSYQLETPEGNLPSLSDRSAVYALPPKKASLLALDQAKTLAKSLGFTDEPAPLSSEIYRFSKQLPALLTLDVHLVNDTFILKYQWPADEGILRQSAFDSELAIQKKAKQALERLGLLRDDLETGETKITFLRASANIFIPTYSLSEADFVKVDLFRTEAEEIPIITPSPDEGNISLIFSGSNQPSKEMILFKYDYFPVDYNSLATYPLKPIESAWEELEQGLAFIARVKETARETIVIRRIELALYDSDRYQPYMQPVYVFMGDDDFIAYLPAILSDWIE